MKTAALVAPVTALEFLQDAFLLSGLSSTTGPDFCDLAVFGGKAVRLVRLHYGEHLRLEILGPLMELRDWALDVRWLSGDKHSLLCVAVAHNSALLLDANTGNALVQRSCLEGCLLYSALLLVHESWTDTVLIGGTVFNQLVVWKPGGGGESSDFDHKAPVERRLLGHSGVIFSISYLQEKGWLASASDDRSVRVWAVGALGGPEGECGDLNPVCLRVLYGHQARVFSVRLSPGKVFSAGEDGACLVWDWARGGTVVRTLKGHRAGGVRALAISEGAGDEATRERWVATGGADGGVRLWKVDESDERKETREDGVTEKLTDLKFTGQGMPKVVRIAGQDKNTSWSQCKFVVCTDQGTVYQYNNGQWEMVWQGTPEFQSYCVMETITISVKDSTAKANLCAVGNLSGSIEVFAVSHPKSGILLTAGSGKIHSLIWQEGEQSVYLLASGAEGLVYRWCIEVKLNENFSLSPSVNSLPSFHLPPCAKRWLVASLCLHSTSEGLLWVCGDRRGSLLLFQEGGKCNQKSGADDEEAEKNVSIGDRTHEITEKTDRNEVQDLTLQPLSCLYGVHGKQGVTSVYEYQGLLYSTGRDGCVRIFRVSQTPPEKLEESRKNNSGTAADNRGRLQLEVLRVQRACKGMEWLERVLMLRPEIPEEEEQEEVRDYHEIRGEVVKMENKGEEARYMSIAVVDEKTDCVLLALACSDGAVRLFSVSEGKRQIDLLWETFYHQRCVLSVATCRLEDGKGNRYELLFSAATDGKIAVWDLTAASSSSTDTPPIPCLDIPAHQSGVNSLAVWAEKLEQQGGCLVTVASGGDDGQLTVSTIRVQYSEDGNTGGCSGLLQISLQTQSRNHLHLHVHSQSHVPLAHAAPLTALNLLKPGLMVSTSSDQRVCLWRVSSTDISHRGALYSHVADAAGLTVWEGQVMEEEDEKRKTWFESEQDIAIWRQRGSQKGLERMSKTGGRFSNDKETTDAGGEPVDAASETDDPISKINDEKGEERAEYRHQTETDNGREAEKKREKTGWVLVCGQGLQLLQVTDTEMDEDMWTEDKERREMRITDLKVSVRNAVLDPGEQGIRVLRSEEVTFYTHQKVKTPLSSPALQRRHQHTRQKRSQQQTSSSSPSQPHPGPPSILLSDSIMTPWGGLAHSESSFTSIPPLPPPRPPQPQPPPPPAPQPTPSTPYRGRQKENVEVSSFNSRAPSSPVAVPRDSAGGGARELRVRRRVLPQDRVPRPPRLPPLRPVTNLSFSRSFTFSFFELPLHQSPRCRAERIRNLMLLLRQIHY
ncbi:hypothetical protein PAMA_021988 [Pampus argenteus]